MPDEFQRAQWYFVDEMGRFLRSYGANEIMGRIIGLLFFATRPMSLQEIADALNFSKAAISIHIRLLESMDVCRKLPPGRDRKDYYEIKGNFGEILFEIGFKKIRESLDMVDKTLAALPDRKKANSAAKEQYRLVTERIKEYRDFLALYNNSIQEIYQKWKAMRQASKEGEDVK
ncbi:MAG: GbsR/MarR family transcriptional regulator [Syntrophothermus sp.]